MTDEELNGMYSLTGGWTQNIAYEYPSLTWLAGVAKAQDRSMNPESCLDLVEIDILGYDSDGIQLGRTIVDVSANPQLVEYESNLKTAKLNRCIAVSLFKMLRDRQIAGESLTTVVNNARDAMNVARNAYEFLIREDPARLLCHQYSGY